MMLTLDNDAYPLEWLPADSALSMGEGWLVSHREGDPYEAHVEKYDEDPEGRFASDDDALAHVKERALSDGGEYGDLCRRALRYCKQSMIAKAELWCGF